MRFTKRLIWLGASVLLGSGPALAQVQQVDTAPTWLRQPSRQDMLSAWPKQALQDGKGGEGVVRCKVTAQGALFDCKAVSETPAGSGFGGAALAVTPQFLMKPAMKDGKAVAYDGVTIPVKFTWSAGAMGLGKTAMTAVVSGVRWLDAPSYADVAAAFPQTAREKKVGGQATVGCIFKDDGHVRDCKVLGETPFGVGFGPAARRLAPSFVGPTAMGQGESIGGAAVQIPITFPVEMIDGAEPVIGKPQWIAVPNADQMHAAIPAGAAAAGVKTARVVLKCNIVTGGALDACAVEKEEPAGLGFGASGLDLAKTFKVASWSSEGLPIVGGQVQLPLRFDVPQSAQAAP